jgi:hypothetical protein
MKHLYIAMAFGMVDYRDLRGGWGHRDINDSMNESHGNGKMTLRSRQAG